jgi:hypothetical protein
MSPLFSSPLCPIWFEDLHWTEELVSGGRIELENFMVFETQSIDRGSQPGELRNGVTASPAPRIIRRLVIRVSKRLRRQLNNRYPNEF